MHSLFFASKGALPPCHIPSLRRLVQNLSVLHGQIAPEPHLPDASGGDKALVGVVVHVCHAVVRPDDMAGTGIVDYDVGVGAGPQVAFPGEQAVHPGRVFAEGQAHPLGADALGCYAVGVDQLATGFHAGQTAGDLGEVLPRLSAPG